MISRLARRMAPAVAAAALALLAHAPLADAHHGGYVSDPYYRGERFAGSHICVALSTSRTWLRDRTVEAVDDWNVHTNLLVFVRSDCSAYGQVISIRATYYGKTGWVGRVITTSRYWGKTAAGHWSWLATRQRIEVNLSYSHTQAQWDKVITHELGHAAGGLGHIARCDSVMRQGFVSCWVRESGSVDRAAVNRIYSQ